MPFSKLKSSSTKHTLGKCNEQNDTIDNHGNSRTKGKKFIVRPSDYRKNNKNDDIELEKQSSDEE